MMRASHLPPIATPALCALRLSLIPTLHLSSSSSTLHRLSTFAPSQTLFPKTLVTNSPYLPSFSLKPAQPMLSMLSNMCTKSTASFSSGSGSGGGREILVQHLLVKEDDLKLLLDIQKKISEGEDLSDLAVEYSICPSKDEGGMLGWVRKGQMVPEFEEAAFNAPINKLVRCKTKFGWHLVQVLSEREESILQDIQPNEFHVKMQDPNFFEEAQLIDVREPEEVAQASLPGFQVLPLCQFGSWGPEISTTFDPLKDTYVLELTTGRMIGSAKAKDGLYYFDDGPNSSRQCQNTCLNSVFVSKDNDIMLCHYRLGHPSFQYLKYLFPNLFRNKSPSSFQYEVCQFVKHYRTSFPTQPYKPTTPFTVIHSDIWGPCRTSTYFGKK